MQKYVYITFLIILNIHVSWLIQTKVDGIQGFSRFFKAKYRHFKGPVTSMNEGVMTKTLTIFSQKLFSRMIFIYIPSWEQNSNINRIFFHQFCKDFIYILYSEQLKPKNNFTRLFKILFLNSRLFNMFKASKTALLIQGYSRIFKACANPVYSCE